MDYKTACEKKNRIKNSACTPSNPDLPFFTYCFFKPNQIAHSQIEKYVLKSQTKEACVKGYIRHVNGMPVLFLRRISQYNVLGNIIHFKEKDRQKAYEKIGYSKHMNIYRWKEIEVNDITANALVSSTPRKIRRSNLMEQNLNYIIHEDDEKYRNLHNYDWRLDPLYYETL